MFKHNNEYENLRKVLVRLKNIEDDINALRQDINNDMALLLKKKKVI